MFMYLYAPFTAFQSWSDWYFNSEIDSDAFGHNSNTGDYSVSEGNSNSRSELDEWEGGCSEYDGDF